MQEKLSIIVPLYNEQDNVRLLHERLSATLQENYDYEVIYVDDGSADETARIILDIEASDQKSKAVLFKRNFGQTAAIMAGIDHATGEILVPLDGDLQNPPEEIPKLITKLQEGYDVCSGWRKDRKDDYLSRNLPSKIANLVISKVSGVHLNDYGCTLKAYRREVIEDAKLYGEMHRFIPIYASWSGARITEIPVDHHPRIHGKSKYGIERTFKVILDLLVIKFLGHYSSKPIYIFGGFGLVNFALSFITFFAMLYYKIWGGKSFIATPLPLIAIVFFLMGFFSILLGLLAEIIMRTYHESQNKPSYLIKRRKD
ncbi:MAG: glycosyltransferase [Kangiellaceae bacterium]|jgi:glycosyltransferase involved in cell wall biosynthesis|nr:glycosyltransferase [Kangiellaceae bacterium]